MHGAKPVATGLKQDIMGFIPWLIVTYLAICIGGYFGFRLFMYFPDPYRATPAEAGLNGVEEVEIPASDGETLVIWYAPAKRGKPTILYFHGNAGNAANRAPKIETIRENGYGILYLNNRGYGGSSGRPSEANNVSDALAAYDHLKSLGVAPRDIAVYGESLGTGQAVKLAAKRDVKAVVLEAPLTTTIEVGRRTYFWLPLSLIITDKFHNEKNIRKVAAPLLILHGEQDRVIPVEQGKRVFAAASEPKRLELFPEGGHSDLFDHGAWPKVEAFLDAL